MMVMLGRVFIRLMYDVSLYVLVRVLLRRVVNLDVRLILCLVLLLFVVRVVSILIYVRKEVVRHGDYGTC